MAINFDPNSLNNVFDKTFGAGAYNSGISNAQKAASLKAQANFAKQDYVTRLKKAQAKALKDQQYLAKYGMTYDDYQAKKAADQQLKQADKQTLSSGYTASDLQKMRDKAQAQGRGGAYPTRDNQLKEAKKTDTTPEGASPYNQQGLTDVNKLTPYAKQKLGLTPSWDTPAKKKTNERTGFFGFLDSTLGRIGNSATEMLFGKAFNDAQNKNYQNIANAKLKQNPNDYAAKANIQMTNTAARPARNGLEKAADFIGGSAGVMAPYTIGGAYGVAEKGLQSLNKLRSIKNPLARDLVRGIGAGAVAGTQRELVQNIASNKDISPFNIGSEALLAGVGDAAFGAIGRGIGRLINKGKQAPQELLGLPTPEVLGLPAPQLRLNEPQLQLQAPKNIKPSLDTLLNVGKKPSGLQNPIPPSPKPISAEFTKNSLISKGVNFGQNTRTLPKARFDTKGIERSIDPLNRPQQYWQKRYEDFVNYVKNNGYTPNILNKDSIQELWSQFAKYDEPVNIDQVVELAYPKGFQVPQSPKGKAEQTVISSEQPSLKDYLDSDPRIKQAIQKLFPNGAADPKISRPATLQEMVQRLQETVPPKKEVKPLDPLIFKTPSANSRKGIDPFPPKLRQGKKFKAIGSNPKGSDITATNPSDGHGYGLIDLQAEANNVMSDNMAKEIQKIKDISQLQVGTKNIYELTSKLPVKMGEAVKNALDAAKQNNISHLENLTKDLFNKIVSKDALGIKKGSKESAMVQDFGEKTLAKNYLKKRGIDPSKLSDVELSAVNLQQLKAIRPNDWKRFVEADKFFRKNYNQLIDQVNAVRSKIYPNNPEKIVPKRTDYYHHFNELQGMEGVKNLFDTPANIDPHLEGVSPYTQPKSKFQGFMQKRFNGKYKSDAVGGYLKYIKAASHSINIDPVIPVLRNTAKQLADATTESKNANKIIEALQDHANDLSGKTNPYDRLLQKLTGRKAFRIINAANSRVKSNVIVGNLASVLGQIGNVPLGIAKAKAFSAPGLADTLTQAANQILNKKDLSAPIYQSNFLKERYSNQFFSKFDQKILEQPKKLAVWMMETADKAGTNFVWNSMYRKGLSQGISDPVKFADTETRNIVAGRGVGEVPLLQKAKTTQILAPFTLEVGNQWKVLKNMVGQKDAIGLMTFLVASYGLNKAMEAIRGSGVSFDPIGAFQQGFQQKDGNLSDKTVNGAASTLGEVVGNIPFGNLLTNQVNSNAKIPMTNMKFADLFGSRNPNRFGSGLTVSKVVTDPLYLLPFGASQIEKTYKGINAIRNNGVYNKNRQLQFPVDQSIPKNLQILAMGPNATSEARDYYNNKRSPLSVKQTQIYQQMGKPYYDQLMQERKQNTVNDKIKKIQKDSTLSPAEKQKNILLLMQQLQNFKK